MRFKSAVALLLIVVVGTTTFPVTGQEEPLPVIQAKGSPVPLTPSVVLPAEVAVPVPLPTLEEAARANDFLTFDALYRDAVRRGDSVAAFTPLHELWTYGITDPIGAFFAADIYERLNRAYPGFDRYIAEYRIVDSNGNVFYPTSETRTFLLDRALEGRATNVQLVDIQRSTSRVELRDTIAGSVWDRTPATSQRSTTTTTRRSTAARRSGTPASSPAGTAASRRRTAPKATKQAASVPAKTEPKAEPKAVAKVEPTAEPKAAARDAAGPAGGDAGVPAAQPTTAAKAPVATETAATTTPTATTAAEPPVVVRAEPLATDTTVATDTAIPVPQPTASDNTFGGRGVLLLVIGLIGVGLLAMMLRTPREAPASIMEPPSTPPGDKPSGPTPVEPIRRPSAAPEPPPPGKNRAGGSHG